MAFDNFIETKYAHYDLCPFLIDLEHFTGGAGQSIDSVVNTVVLVEYI